MIKIARVERKNGVVSEVGVEFGGRIEILFRRTENGIREVSRCLIGDERLYDRGKLWIPDGWYKKMVRQVWAIFGKKRK
ncbi:MAG: hypothetical protein ACP5IX_02165 [Patescibacteria group bacterium]